MTSELVKARPDGVTILAVLDGLGAAILLGFGMIMVMAGPFVGSLAPFAGAFAGLILSAVGLLFVFLGVITFVVAWGLWNGKKWAWWFTVVFSVLGMIFGLTVISDPVGLGGVIGAGNMAFNFAILYYFMRRRVKYYFGLLPDYMPL